MFDWLTRYLPYPFRPRGPVVPVVRLAGAIGIASPFAENLSARGVAHALEAAFAMRDAPAVALVINSPGGSAVQSHLIHRRIRQLAAEKDKPVIAFVEDAAASGGYMIACAADEIIADPSSILGSIGVVSRGFGFVGLMEKLGVERRLYAAGDSKGMLDPFRPAEPGEVGHLERLQGEIHTDFIALVRECRGARLVETEDALFSGLFWSGRRALALGLIDGLGDLRGVLRERYGEKVRLRPIGLSRRGLLSRLFRMQGSTFLAETEAYLETRALWARYGL